MLVDDYEKEVLISDDQNDEKVELVIVKSSFKEYSSKIDWIVFLFICLFTLGSWLDISGLWSEMPLMCNSLPEGWRLPSILTAISQSAQIGPFLFLLGKWLHPKSFTYVKAIYFIFLIGALSCLLLSLFWNKTMFVFHEKRSIYLYIFNFSLSLLDGMSTITFLPYIGGYFSKEYIIPNYIGESLSSLIPGLLAIIQGIETSNNKDCSSNSTSSNQTISIQRPPGHGPKYSVSVYFLLMFSLLLVSVVAFTMLNFSQRAIKARKSNKETLHLSTLNNQTDMNIEHKKTKTNYENKILFIITFLGAFINYGYMPGLLSYSTIPYGNIYFHLSINLSSICLPISILLSIWSYKVKIQRILLEFSLAITLSIYILVISIKSPCPPFNNQLGGCVIVSCWVLSSCLFIRVRCLTAARLEAHGQHTLMLYGLVTIIGQIIGGILIFLLVDVFRLFTDKPKCTILSFCN